VFVLDAATVAEGLRVCREVAVRDLVGVGVGGGVLVSEVETVPATVGEGVGGGVTVSVRLCVSTGGGVMVVSVWERAALADSPICDVTLTRRQATSRWLDRPVMPSFASMKFFFG
jgi:hypothetical protein